MMTEFRKFLVWINNKSIEDNKKLIRFNFISIISCFILGTLLDIIFGNNNLINIFKASIVLFSGTNIFTLYFTQADKYFSNDREQFRSTFSYRQRINIALLVLSVVIVLYAMLISPNSVIYTFVSSLLFAVILGFISFVRPTSDELIRKSYGLSDERDILHIREVKERDEQLRELKEKKKKEQEEKRKNRKL